MPLNGLRRATAVVVFVVAIGTLAGCIKKLDRRFTTPQFAATLDGKSPFLKAHLRSGFVYVLSAWHVDSGGAAIHGRGWLLGLDRLPVAEGAFSLSVDSVALFETNVLQTSGATKALTVMAGVTAAVAGICIANPKSCFGSCPTFYVADSSGDVLQAEGFSSSIAPGLEATDVDMLYRVRPASRDFALRMTNEALETHVIRHADLLAAPSAPAGRVFVTSDGVFRAATGQIQPSRCRAAEGDCRAAVVAFDGLERASLADSVDLAARETIELEFDQSPAGEVGLVVASRQTLMTTYLLYQALAYLGNDAAHWLASIASGGPAARERAGALGRTLGRIDVLIPDRAGGWTLAGSVGETGPLAVDTKVVPLRLPAGRPLRLRLQLTKGLWRLNYLALVALGDSVTPLRIPPHSVRRGRRDDPEARAALVDSSRVLVTLPGDTYELAYRLPPDPEGYELFLEARGYYLEWMRREWMAEENPLLAARMALDPAGALRALAPSFKNAEPSLERLFWSSRYVRR